MVPVFEQGPTQFRQGGELVLDPHPTEGRELVKPAMIFDPDPGRARTTGLRRLSINNTREPPTLIDCNIWTNELATAGIRARLSRQLGRAKIHYPRTAALEAMCNSSNHGLAPSLLTSHVEKSGNITSPRNISALPPQPHHVIVIGQLVLVGHRQRGHDLNENLTPSGTNQDITRPTAALRRFNEHLSTPGQTLCRQTRLRKAVPEAVPSDVGAQLLQNRLHPGDGTLLKDLQAAPPPERFDVRRGRRRLAESEQWRGGTKLGDKVPGCWISSLRQP